MEVDGRDHNDMHEKTSAIQYASIFLLWSLVVVTFYQFFTRYVLNDSAAWTEEVAQYGLVIIVFVGSIIVSQKNGHIRMLIVRTLLPAALRRVLVMFSAFLEVILISALFFLSIRMLQPMHEERMVFANIPLSTVYIGIALFLGMHIIYDVKRLLKELKSK